MRYYVTIDVDQHTGWSHVEADGRMPFMLADELKRVIEDWAKAHKD